MNAQSKNYIIFLILIIVTRHRTINNWTGFFTEIIVLNLPFPRNYFRELPGTEPFYKLNNNNNRLEAIFNSTLSLLLNESNANEHYFEKIYSNYVNCIVNESRNFEQGIKTPKICNFM